MHKHNYHALLGSYITGEISKGKKKETLAATTCKIYTEVLSWVGGSEKGWKKGQSQGMQAASNS